MNKAMLDTLANLAAEMADQGRTAEVQALRKAVSRLGRQEGLITTGEAAERLQISVPTVRRWLEREALAGVNLGTRWLVSEESVERVLRIRLNLRDMAEEGYPTEEELADLEHGASHPADGERIAWAAHGMSRVALSTPTTRSVSN